VIADRLRALAAHREILFMITWREVVVKYKQSLMGFLWAILMPLVIVGAGILVRGGFAYLAHQPLRADDIAAVTLKSVPWAFAVASIRFATNSLSSNANLVTRIYVPREIFPLSAIGSQLVDFGMAAVPLIIVLAIAGVGVSVQLLWVPLIVVILVLLVAALGIVLSAGSLFFRDVKYLVEVMLTFAIFVTPVLYDVDTFARWKTWLMLNPIAPLLEGLTAAVIHHRPPDLPWLAYSAGFTLVALLSAFAVFAKLEPRFAESV